VYKRLVCLLIALLVTAGVVVGQEFRASISGGVTDPAGAAVQGATVVLTSVERNVKYEATSNAAGRYLVQFLQPGKYNMTVEKTGFKRFVHDGIALLSADRIGLDVKLELGAVSDAVTVTGEVPLLQTESASRTSTVENRIMENVPSGGRNLYALEYSQPGVLKTSTYWGSMELYASGNVNGVMIGGGRNQENETVLDGVTNTQSSRGIAFVPSLNGTQEFTIRTNNYDAQYGRVGGGVMQITVKSGTNSLHGQLFEHFKNEKLMSMDWETNKNGDPKSPWKNNTFGFELDGPFYIPKVLDGRNKAFFMISLEGLREHFAGFQTRTIPSEAQKGGDFSQLLGDDGLISIYDPLTTTLGSDGKTYTRTPFGGNKIPTTRISPVAANIVKFLPAANLPGDGPMHEGNYARTSSEHNEEDSWLGKMDYHFSDRSAASFRYGQTPWSNWAKRVWGDNAAEPSGEWPSMRIFRNWGADWTYTISPSLVFNLRGGLARYEGFSGNTYAAGFDPRQLGFPSSLVSQFTWLQFPRFNFSGGHGYSEIGATTVQNYSTNDTWSIQPNISWTKGRHFLKIGTEFRRYNDNNIGPGSASGVYNFTNAYTQANPFVSSSTSGNDFATFLLGYPSGGQVDRNMDSAYRSHYYAMFVQDDFKASSKLTLNLGLRWDYETPRLERFDRMIAGFALGQASPISAGAKASADAANCPACAAGLTGGLIYANTGGLNRYAFDPKKGNIQPRLGVAYKALPKMVLRGGYAISYLGQNYSGAAYGYSRPTPLVASLDGGLTPAATLSDPFPTSIYPSGLLQPVGNSQGLSTNLGQGIAFPYRDRPLPYSQQYSVGFQYELPGKWLVDASYVGNQTKRLPVDLSLNFLTLDQWNAVPLDQRVAYFSTQVANPMAGLIPNSSLNGAKLSRAQLLYKYPQYTGVTAQQVPIGSQKYDAMQLQFTHRYSNGLSLQVGYSISKTFERVSVLNYQTDVDPNNLLNTKLEHRLIAYDVPQQLQIIGTYDLPFGKGRPLFSGMHPILNGVFGGWTFSGQWQSHSGYPMTFPNAAPLAARSAKLGDAQRDANAQALGRTQWDVSYDKWIDVTLFPKTAGPAPYTLRNFPTMFPDVRTRPLNILDASIYKEFPIREKIRWQLRLDAHNAGNFPWFAKWQSNDVTNSRFGQLQASMGNDIRVFVIVAKLLF